MVIFVGRRDGLLVNRDSSVGQGWRQRFSHYWNGAVDLDVVEAGRFDQGRLLDRHSLDFRGWFHQVHLLEGLDGAGDDDAPRGYPLVGRLSVVWSRGC